ncbi:hypothetical protein BRADI_3g48340v3 [Brachypodium distachyon]|uniref:PARG helical domain-containing protein n=1 Tax=Brachypodium distachyon TaxID=15368 RepID=I1IBF3_BRADI|nr:hypothetical protein BRADI_3g48340v3 [Brachypodium distachyon]
MGDPAAAPGVPIVLQGGALFWPAAAQEQLKALALGLDVSRVTSAAEGLALFFDDRLSRIHARDWFSDVLPRLARLLLRLPALLKDPYTSARGGVDRTLGLRLLGPLDAGLVLLGQELAATLLACTLFDLVPHGRSEPGTSGGAHEPITMLNRAGEAPNRAPDVAAIGSLRRQFGRCGRLRAPVWRPQLRFRPPGGHRVAGTAGDGRGRRRHETTEGGRRRRFVLAGSQYIITKA